MKKLFSTLLIKLVSICILCFLVILSAHASDPEQDLQLWPVVAIELPVVEDKLSLYSETIPFAVNNLSSFNRVQIRNALIYKPNKTISLWAGGDYFPSLGEDALQESRAWQQIRFNNKLKNFSIDTRFRLEERFIDKESEIAVRNRNRIKITHPIGKSKNYVAFGDEIFFNLNSVNDNLQAGLSENRWYFGVGRKINEYVNLEAGYQLSYVFRPQQEDFIRHIIRVETSIKLPSITKWFH